MLARQYIPLEIEDEDLRTILLNAHINDHYLSLAREVINVFNGLLSENVKPPKLCKRHKLYCRFLNTG